MSTPKTILCQILAVQALPTGGVKRWAITLGDGKEQVVTVELDEASLQTYERFQNAVYQETGHTFRYLPFGTGLGSDPAAVCPLAIELTRLATQDDPG
jgi:hypothetical protein